jgi:hypothetical protein
MKSGMALQNAEEKKTTNSKKRKKRKEKDMPDDQRESATATDPITKEIYIFFLVYRQLLYVILMRY